MSDAPKRISKASWRIDLSGYVTPFDDRDQPVLLSMPGTDDLFVSVFSSPEKLHQLWADYPGLHPFSRIKVIINGSDFVTSIADAAPHLRVVADPYKHPETGRLRFTELIIRAN